MSHELPIEVCVCVWRHTKRDFSSSPFLNPAAIIQKRRRRLRASTLLIHHAVGRNGVRRRVTQRTKKPRRRREIWAKKSQLLFFGRVWHVRHNNNKFRLSSSSSKQPTSFTKCQGNENFPFTRNFSPPPPSIVSSLNSTQFLNLQLIKWTSVSQSVGLDTPLRCFWFFPLWHLRVSPDFSFSCLFVVGRWVTHSAQQQQQQQETLDEAPTFLLLSHPIPRPCSWYFFFFFTAFKHFNRLDRNCRIFILSRVRAMKRYFFYIFLCVCIKEGKRLRENLGLTCWFG